MKIKNLTSILFVFIICSTEKEFNQIVSSVNVKIEGTACLLAYAPKAVNFWSEAADAQKGNVKDFLVFAIKIMLNAYLKCVGFIVGEEKAVAEIGKSKK